jgi:ABC-type branched-subunit amino acid transport system substrate-binding protein
VPYIDLKFVDSLKIELTNMDSISALWLLAKTDTVLFPYLFPFEKYGIDAVYMPIPQNHIQYLAPQWAKNRFKTQLLGDGNWYNTSLLERYKSNIDSMIIASDYYWDSRDLQLRRFAKNFTDKTGLQPNRIHIYGYESMDLLMTLIEKGSPAAKDIQDQLLNLEDQHGIIRKITFKPEKPRSSSGVRLIRFYKGKISLIQ